MLSRLSKLLIFRIMQTIEVAIKIPQGETDPLCVYTIQGWGDNAAEFYSIGKDSWLVLCNTHSTGFRRKVFKNASTAHRWARETLRKQFSCQVLDFQWKLPSE